MMKPRRPVPHQMACAQPEHPRPEIGHRAQEQEPGVVGHQMQPVILVAQRPANPRVTRLALQRRRRERRQRHPLATPPRAIPHCLAHLRRRPEVMMRRHQGAEPRLLLRQHRAERHLRKLHPVSGASQPLFKHLYRNSSRKSTPKRIRLEIQQSQSEQKSALLNVAGPFHASRASSGWAGALSSVPSRRSVGSADAANRPDLVRISSSGLSIPAWNRSVK